jgi:LDH2 family malate/lactate/ureidoglycolate dehydrogenase
MKMSISDARALAIEALKGIRFNQADAEVTADHLVDAAMRGVAFGSLPRILAIAERMAETGDRRQPIKVIRETPTSAVLDGGDNVGYVVAHRATNLAIEKALGQGIGIVAANNTFYSGLFSYYMEMATRKGLIAMAIGNGPAMVAPEGAAEGRLGTNPIAFGFPSEGDPVIWDIGTCSIMHGDVMLHRRLGRDLPEGVALDGEGQPTRDPVAALAGAIKTWGGHRGSGLAIVVQMLGALCGGPVIPAGLFEMAYLVIVIDPKLLMPGGDYPAKVSDLASQIRSARPTDPSQPVRMPFERSAKVRRDAQEVDAVEVPDVVHQGLVKLASQVRG